MRNIHHPTARELSRAGLGDRSIERVARLVREAPSGIRKDEPMNKDSLLLQPTENWEKSDFRPPGRMLFFHPADSAAYRKGYDLIDWSK